MLLKVLQRGLSLRFNSVSFATVIDLKGDSPYFLSSAAALEFPPTSGGILFDPSCPLFITSILPSIRDEKEHKRRHDLVESLPFQMDLSPP